MLINFEKNILKNNKGFSIMEMIVVLAIFSLGLLGIASLMLQTMQAEATNAGYLRASMLAQEGIELVRGYRDDNWLNESATDWDDNFGDIDTDGDYIIDYTTDPTSINDNPDSISDSATILLKDAAGYYQYNTGTPTIFRRLITVVRCLSDDCYNIESKVNWSASGKHHSYVAKTRLYNWR